ncbi:MAG TPA: nucleoside triphosphate pyrophosphohydrolase [Symbiobacteriaceae bacterium]|nr:nucleoside triphosphate pyrophosphohydrolase [Symbiobacteriaceae bacterium]
MPEYNKLVRDRIPEIIEASGRRCEVRELNDEEYLAALNRKLGEELQEYLADGSLGELADLVEVVNAIVLFRGHSLEEFEQIRMEKQQVRGGFTRRVLLVSTVD